MPMPPPLSLWRRLLHRAERSVPVFFGLLLGLGVVGTLAIHLVVWAPFLLVQVGGFVAFIGLALFVLHLADDPPWLRAVAFLVFVIPTFLSAVLSPVEFAGQFDQPTAITQAERSLVLPARQGCFGLYRYEAGGTTYRRFLSPRRGCDRRILVQYVRSDPRRVRALNVQGHSGPPRLRSQSRSDPMPGWRRPSPRPTARQATRPPVRGPFAGAAHAAS